MIWKIIRLNPYLIMKMVLMNGLWSGRIWINVKNGERKRGWKCDNPETQQGDGKRIMVLKTIVNQLIFGVGIRRNSSLRLLLHLLFFMDMNSGAVVSLVNPRER
jgi:hypothetical protein